MNRRPFAGGLAVRVCPPTARVDILPYVNLFLTLVPFLLLCATFAPLAAAQLQAAGTSTRGGFLVLRIKPNSFAFESVSKQASTWVGRPVDPRDGSRKGYEQLAEACQRIKGRIPDITTLTVIPGDDVPYEDVIETLDTLRRAKTFPDLVLGTGAEAP